MKTLSIILIAVMLAVCGVVSAELAEVEVLDEESIVGCPITQMTKDCMACHKMVLENGKPKFGLKEIAADANYGEKPYGTQIHFRDGKAILYHMVDSIGVSAGRMEEIYRYLQVHPEIETLSVEIYSSGGSVMAAWKIIGYFELIRELGVVIETKCGGLAASAGGIILIGGDIGHRHVAKHAEIMIHKLWVFSMFEIADVDSAEDKAEMLKHFQKNINRFFEDRTNLTREEIDQSTKHRMWWFNGDEAIEHGVADHLIGEYKPDELDNR